MQKKCSKCGKNIREAGRLVRVNWLGFRAPLCKQCRKDLRSKKRDYPSAGRVLRRLR